MTFAYFNAGPSAAFDDDAVEFVRQVRSQLQSVDDQVPQIEPPPGPDFEFDRSPDLFLGRRGSGPLRVAWDTNVVIDYLTHGRRLWFLDDEGFDRLSLDDDHVEDLELLRFVLATWILRSVEFLVLPRSISDAKKALSAERSRQRVELRFDLERAIELVADEPTAGQRFAVSASTVEKAVAKVPAGADRELAEQAYEAGTQVFLTRDRGVLAADEALRRIGLRALTPGGLFDLLLESGDVLCCWYPERFVRWPLPDLARYGLVVRSLQTPSERDRPEPISAPARWIMDRLARRSGADPTS